MSGSTELALIYQCQASKLTTDPESLSTEYPTRSKRYPGLLEADMQIQVPFHTALRKGRTSLSNDQHCIRSALDIVHYWERFVFGSKYQLNVISHWY